mgnify:CR=1 FL=1
MKKLISILCAGAMLLSLAACGAKADTTYAGQTITGKVTALEGTSVTLAPDELTEDAAPGGDSQQPPEMSSDGQTGDQPTGTPPEKPEDTSGDNQSGQQPPEKPDGDSSQSNDNQPPEMPEGGMGGSSFTESGETLTAKNGDMIYVTNTHCVLTLSGVTIQNEDADGALLRVVGNSASHGWGTAGSNGAQVEFTADNQTLNGDIVVDTISTLNMKLTGGSTFTGTISIVDNAQNGTAVSNNAVVTIESGCTWTLTGDCVITSLTNSGTINFNGYTITLADGTVLR